MAKNPTSRRAFCLLSAALLLLGVLTETQAQAPAAGTPGVPYALTPLPAGPGGAVLTSGATLLGVRNYGSIGVPGGSMSSGPCDKASLSGGTNSKCSTTIGLRIASLNLEGLADGCVCEGWGVKFQVGAPSGDFTEGDVQPGMGGATDGLTNVALVSFSYGPLGQNPTWATSIVDVGSHLRVTHEFTVERSMHNLDNQNTAFHVNVTLQNVGKEPLFNIGYRRIVDFDAEPTPANEVVGYMLCNNIQAWPSCSEGAQRPAACGNPPSELAYLSSDANYPASPAVAPSAGSTAYGQAPAPFVTVPKTVCPTQRLYNAVAGPGDLGLLIDFNFTNRPSNIGNPAVVGKGGYNALKSGEARRFYMWYGAEKVVQQRNPSQVGGTVDDTFRPCNNTAQGSAPLPTDTSCGAVASQDKAIASLWNKAVAAMPVQVPLPFAPPPVFDITANAVDCVLKQSVPSSLLGNSPMAGTSVAVPWVIGMSMPSAYRTTVPYPGPVALPGVTPLPFITMPGYGGPYPTLPAPPMPEKSAAPNQACPTAAGASVTPGGNPAVGLTYDLIPGSILPVLAPGGNVEAAGSASASLFPLKPSVTIQPSVVLCFPGTTTNVMQVATLTTPAPGCPGTAAVVGLCLPGVVGTLGPGPFGTGIPTPVSGSLPVVGPVPGVPLGGVASPAAGTSAGYNVAGCLISVPSGVCAPGVVLTAAGIPVGGLVGGLVPPPVGPLPGCIPLLPICTGLTAPAGVVCSTLGLVCPGTTTLIPAIPCVGPDPYTIACKTVAGPGVALGVGSPVCPLGSAPPLDICSPPLAPTPADETIRETGASLCTPAIVGESATGQPEHEICELIQTQICVISHSSYVEGAGNSGPEGTGVGSGSGDSGAGAFSPGDGGGGYGACGTQYPTGTPCGKDTVEVDGYYFWGFHNDTNECIPPPPLDCTVIQACGAFIPPKKGSGVICDDPTPTFPHAVFTTNMDPCNAPDVVEFSDESFGDAPSVITSWYWDFGDGTTSDQQSPTHEYAADGDYTVTLTVYDQFGAHDIKVQILHITSGCSTIDPHPSLGGGSCGEACKPHDYYDVNRGLMDSDGDNVTDNLDNCPYVRNADQADLFHTGYGDVCNPDLDGDGVLNQVDNCPRTPNKTQADLDGDKVGDACDPDCDGDGVLNTLIPPCGGGAKYDNCPMVANADQHDSDSDGIGDACSGLILDQAGAGGRVGTARSDGNGVRPTSNIKSPLRECINQKGLLKGMFVCVGPIGWGAGGLLVLVSAWVALLMVARRRAA